MKRCPVQGKKKFRDAGDAARFVRRGEFMGVYKCSSCGYYHPTKMPQQRWSSGGL